MNFSLTIALARFLFLSISCLKQASSQKPLSEQKDATLLNHLSSLSSLGYNNTTVRLPKSSKTFALNKPESYCKVAQTVIENITSTKLISSTQISFQDFDSSATNCCSDSRDTSYLVHQFVGAATIGGINETVLCQMTLNEEASTKRCSDINKKLVRDVKKGSPMLKSGKRMIYYDIVYENLATYSKQQWIDPLEPYRTAYIHEDTGKLHLVSKELKSGKLHYCQTIEAKYLHRVLSGSLLPPTCKPPRPYNDKGVPTSNSWRCP
eukprot:scaffold2808_cov143-Skeletonema_menzelii.AAC.16